MIYHHDYEPYPDYMAIDGRIMSDWGYFKRELIRLRWRIVRPFVLHKYRYFGSPLPPKYKGSGLIL